MRLIIGITGATGAIIGIRLLQALRESNVETHLILSKWAEATIALETEYTVSEVKGLASHFYAYYDQAAPISSGSYRTDGMIIAPCSMKSLASIRVGLSDNLITRAADVVLKERKKLVIVPRETPLNSIHLENMLYLSNSGAVIVPPMPAFYNKPKSLDDVVNHFVARILDQFGIDNDYTTRWGEKQEKKSNEK